MLLSSPRSPTADSALIPLPLLSPSLPPFLLLAAPQLFRLHRVFIHEGTHVFNRSHQFWPMGCLGPAKVGARFACCMGPSSKP